MHTSTFTSFALTFLMAACSADPSQEPPVQAASEPTNDAGLAAPDKDGGAPPPATAPTVDASTPSQAGLLVKRWLYKEVGSFWRTEIFYTFKSDGTMTFEMRRADINSTYADCTRTRSGSGTWSVQGNKLDAVLVGGTTERFKTSPFKECGIGADETYAPRPMTAEELKGTDLADASYEVSSDGKGLTTHTFYTNGKEAPWKWEPAP